MARYKSKILKAHLTRVAELGCLVCKRPPQLHHIRVNTGIGRRSSDWCCIPLCMDHHTGKFSIHGSKRTFVEQMGTELELLEKVYKTLYKEEYEKPFKLAKEMI